MNKKKGKTRTFTTQEEFRTWIQERTEAKDLTSLDTSRTTLEQYYDLVHDKLEELTKVTALVVGEKTIIEELFGTIDAAISSITQEDSE